MASTHMLAFWALITAIIAAGLVLLLEIFTGVSHMATDTGVLMMSVAAAALKPATGILIGSVTAASEVSRTVASAAA